MEASALSTVDAAPRGALRLAAAVAGAPLSVELTELGLVPLRARARVVAERRRRRRWRRSPRPRRRPSSSIARRSPRT